MPDYSPWGSNAMAGLGNWNLPSPTAPATPAPPAVSPVSGVSAPVPTAMYPNSGLTAPAGGSPPAPQLPGGSGLTQTTPGARRNAVPTSPQSQPQAMPTQSPNRGPGLGNASIGGGGMAQQPGVSGLGPLLQLLMGGGNRAGGNPITSLLQMLAQNRPSGGGIMPPNSGTVATGMAGNIPIYGPAPSGVSAPGIQVNSAASPFQGQGVTGHYVLSPEEQKLGRPFTQEEIDQQRANMFGPLTGGGSREEIGPAKMIGNAAINPAAGIPTLPNLTMLANAAQTQAQGTGAGQQFANAGIYPGSSLVQALSPSNLPGGNQGLPASNPMSGPMNALLAQQLMPTRLSGMPASNPLSAQMNALLMQQLMPR